MSHLDRILDDGTDRDSWLISRRTVIGASDAAKLSKASSVDLYLAAKLARSTFTGNAYTASGHRWEPMMLAWAGIASNVALIHAPDQPGFAATPDGISATGALTLAECKARHGKATTGPSLGEWRQIAWQFHCLPEAATLQFLWVDVDIDVDEMTHDEPHLLVIPRTHPKVIAQTALILPIATELLARLQAAHEFERDQ